MKKVFSCLFCVAMLCACSSGLLANAKDYVGQYNARLTTDTSAALTFWSSDFFKSQEISANIELQIKEMGTNSKNARFETLSAKAFKTWVFAGTIFKDVVEVESKIVVPQDKPSDGNNIAQSKVFRQITYVGFFDGKPKIIESQMREMK